MKGPPPTVPEELAVSHIAIHDDVDGVTRYCQFADLESAVAYLEEQQNAAPNLRAKLFALREVHFEVKPYYKIEVVDDWVAAPERVPIVADEVAAPAARSRVEGARSEPIETFASETFAPVEPRIRFAEPAAGHDVRRGLFGR